MAVRARDDGFILIVVLLILAILAVISLGFSRAVQSQLRNSSSALRAAQAESLADAGIGLVMLDLLATRSSRLHAVRFRVDGVATACRITDAATLGVTVQDASGLINLNLADDSLIMAVLIGSGITPTAATEYAQRIVDYRDSDDARQLAGAEKDDYLRAGLARGPKNAGLDSVLELHQVLGMPSHIVALLAAVSTLNSGTAGLDVTVTPQALLAAVKSGLSQLPGAAGADNGALPSELSATSLKRFYNVRATVWLDGQGAFVRDTEIDLQAGRAMPSLKTWSRGDDTRQNGRPADTRDLPAC